MGALFIWFSALNILTPTTNPIRESHDLGKLSMFEILVIVIDSMCGDPILDLLYLAIPTVLLGAGAFFMIGKDNRKKIEEIFR